MRFRYSELCEAIGCALKIVARYNRPFPRPPPLLCLEQRSFPLLSGVVLGALLCKDGFGNFEGAMRCAIVAGCIAGAIKLLRCGLQIGQMKDIGATPSVRQAMLANFIAKGNRRIALGPNLEEFYHAIIFLARDWGRGNTE
jgi:hypothetical protein